MNTLHRSTGIPWMIWEPSFRAMCSQSAKSQASLPADWQAQQSARMGQGTTGDDGTGRYSVVNGVACIAVYGPIYRHSTPLNDYLAFLFGGISVDALTGYIGKASSDPAVKSILFLFDSPGGEAAGIGELAGMIRATTKPVAAYVESSCCSAAYYLASACGEITAAPMALIGSIGTVICLIDDSAFQAAIGIKEIPIVSSQSPNKWPDITTDEGVASYQSIADSLSTVFIADVAKYRGETVEMVMSDFGQGGVMIADAARKAGMIDKVGTSDDVIRKMSGGNRAKLAKSTGQPLASQPNQTTALSSPAPLRLRLRTLAPQRRA